MTIPVIDIFAGPGGLGEGFAASGFDVALSCEMDPVACETLKLRKFYHLFKKEDVPEEYYQVIKGLISQNELKKSHKNSYEQASEKVMCVELGNEKTRREVHLRIRNTLGKFKNGKNFVLVGGPPCQAYSLAGRSRRLGGYPVDENGDRIPIDMLGAEGIREIEVRQKEFYEDPKHTLYLEYLEIIALHRPAVFIMENVKGMTSAKQLNADGHVGETIFDKVMEDLRAPSKAVADKEHIVGLADEFSLHPNTNYRLVTLSHKNVENLLSEVASGAGKDFLLNSEDYGVPQARHRVFVVGVRSDLAGIIEKLNPQPTTTVFDTVKNMPKLRSGLSKTTDSSANWAAAIQREFDERLKGEEIPKSLMLARHVKNLMADAGNLNRGGKFVKFSDKFSEKNEEYHNIQTWLRDVKLGGVIQHETRGHISSDLARYLYCSAYAQNFSHGKSPKIHEWHTEKLKPNHRNVKIGKTGSKLKTTTHSDRFKVQVWEKPATTLVCHISKDGHYFIHPDPEQCRSLTVREAARLQTFPDNYFFCGNRTQQYHQVGNAVPPYLAKQIAQNVRKFIENI